MKLLCLLGLHKWNKWGMPIDNFVTANGITVDKFKTKYRRCIRFGCKVDETVRI